MSVSVIFFFKLSVKIDNCFRKYVSNKFILNRNKKCLWNFFIQHQRNSGKGKNDCQSTKHVLAGKFKIIPPNKKIVADARCLIWHTSKIVPAPAPALQSTICCCKKKFKKFRFIIYRGLFYLKKGTRALLCSSSTSLKGTDLFISRYCLKFCLIFFFKHRSELELELESEPPLFFTAPAPQH